MPPYQQKQPGPPPALADILVSGGLYELEGDAFVPDNQEVRCYVTNDVTEVTVAAIPAENDMTVKICGAPVTAVGVARIITNLAIGRNPVPILVVGVDKQIKSYHLFIIRADAIEGNNPAQFDTVVTFKTQLQQPDPGSNGYFQAAQLSDTMSIAFNKVQNPIGTPVRIDISIGETEVLARVFQTDYLNLPFQLINPNGGDPLNGTWINGSIQF